MVNSRRCYRWSRWVAMATPPFQASTAIRVVAVVAVAVVAVVAVVGRTRSQLAPSVDQGRRQLPGPCAVAPLQRSKGPLMIRQGGGVPSNGGPCRWRHSIIPCPWWSGKEEAGSGPMVALARDVIPSWRHKNEFQESRRGVDGGRRAGGARRRAGTSVEGVTGGPAATKGRPLLWQRPAARF